MGEAPTLSNAVRFSSIQNESFDERLKVMQVKRDTEVHSYAVTNQKQNVEESHQNRMKELRKELDYLRETEWKYEPIEKYIGQ